VTSPDLEARAGARLAELLERGPALAWVVAAAALAYLALAVWGGWDGVARAVAAVGPTGMLAALMLALLNFVARWARWRMYLSATGHQVPRTESVRIYFAGFALTVTPAKLGETIRCVLLHRWNVPYRHGLALMLGERLSDLLVIVALTLLGLWHYPPARPMATAGAALVLGLLGLVLLQGRHESGKPATARSRLATLVHQLGQVLQQTGRLQTPRLLVPATALGLAAWLAEGLALHLILQRMGLASTPAFSVFVFAVAMLAGALSFMPGGLGGAEAALVTLLVFNGASTSTAVAATLVLRLTTLWFAVLLGLVALARVRAGHDAVPGPTACPPMAPYK
jgi:uncharacterized protein (TIRG00374 family)